MLFDIVEPSNPQTLKPSNPQTFKEIALRGGFLSIFPYFCRKNAKIFAYIKKM